MGQWVYIGMGSGCCNLVTNTDRHSSHKLVVKKQRAKGGGGGVGRGGVLETWPTDAKQQESRRNIKQ